MSKSQQRSEQDQEVTEQIFEFVPDRSCAFVDFLGGVNYIPTQDNRIIFNRVVTFFRNIINTIENKNQIQHFKLNVEPSPETGFCVKIIRIKRRSPAKVLNCIACDLESITAKTSRLEYSFTKNEENLHHKLWLDAKARPMFIITPIRHIERLSECNNEELFEMFHLACKILDEESASAQQDLQFIRMTLNHGNARNLEHLHLKIKVTPSQFKQVMEHGWDEDKRRRFQSLKSGLYKSDERLKKI